MELIFGLLGSSILAYFANKLERIESKMDNLERDINLLKWKMPKRFSDRDKSETD